MGQYYRGVVLHKDSIKSQKIKVKKAFCCYAHNNGAKLMEHSYVTNEYVKAYEHELATKSFGNPFVWCGDYADEKFGTNIYDAACEYINNDTLKRATKQGYVKKDSVSRFGECFVKETKDSTIIKSDIQLTYRKAYNRIPEYKYIINLDKKLYVQIPSNINKLTIHPLPLLCCSGNQRGGGDYYGTNEQLVGSWAYDRIGVTNDVPQDFTELVVTFEEN